MPTDKIEIRNDAVTFFFWIKSINITVSPLSIPSCLVVSAELQFVLEGSWLIFIIKAIGPIVCYPGECPHRFPYVQCLHHEMWSSVIALVNTMHIIQFTLSYTNAVKVLQKSVMINQIEGFSEVEKCDSNNFFSIASFQLCNWRINTGTADIPARPPNSWMI